MQARPGQEPTDASIPGPDPSVPQSHGGQVRAWLSRAGVLLVAMVLLRLAFEMWWVARLHEHVWTQVGTTLLYLAGAVFLFLAAANVRHERLDVAGFLVLCGALAFYSMVQVRVVSLHYTSDALLFVHESAHLVLNGLNPYQHSLAGGYEAFQVPYYVQTPTSSGGLITNLNYPAVSFLVYAPFVALGVEDLRPVSVAFLLATLGLVFLATPRHLRLVCLGLLFTSSFFLAFSLNGFDIVYIFFLLVTVVAWQRNPALAMVAFGLACATKQPVWFIAPFLLIRLWKDTPAGEGRVYTTSKHVAYAIAAFLIPNAWFLANDPLSWLQGVLTPLGGTGDILVPLSQGLTILFYTRTLDVTPWLLSVLGGSILFFLLALYWLHYGRLRETLWVAPSLILLVSERALQNYFEMFYPILLAILMATVPHRWRAAAEPDPPSVAFATVGTHAPAPAPAWVATAVVARNDISFDTGPPVPLGPMAHPPTVGAMAAVVAE